MNLQLMKAGTSDALVLNSISRQAFDSDTEVGAASPCGPPGYRSVSFHVRMARTNAFYTRLGYSEVKRDVDLVYYSKNR